MWELIRKNHKYAKRTYTEDHRGEYTSQRKNWSCFLHIMIGAFNQFKKNSLQHQFTLYRELQIVLGAAFYLRKELFHNFKKWVPGAHNHQ